MILNLNFGDDDLKDALTGGDGDPDCIKVHDHYDNLFILDQKRSV